MPIDDRILNLVSYVVVFVIGAIVGGFAGLYFWGRLTLFTDPTTVAICGTVGALVGGVACVVFGFTHKHGKSTLREVHERMDGRKK